MFRTSPAIDNPPVPEKMMTATGEKRVNTVDGMNTYLDQSIDENPFCPPGYRLPNDRELAVYFNFLPKNEAEKAFFQKNGKNTAYTRTYWTFGQKGDNDKEPSQKYYGVGATWQKMIMVSTSSHTTSAVRCVKDIKVN